MKEIQFVVTVLPGNGRASRSDASLLTVETEYHPAKMLPMLLTPASNAVKGAVVGYNPSHTNNARTASVRNPDSIPTRLPTGTSQCQSNLTVPNIQTPHIPTLTYLLASALPASKLSPKPS
jgi:hypothetical protein